MTETSNLSPTDDTHLDEKDPDTAKGSSDKISVGCYKGYHYWGLIQFDLSSFTEIKSAILYLYFAYSNASSNYSSEDVYFYRVTSSWDEGSATWNSKPSYDSDKWATITVDFSESKWYDIDFTTLAEKWINGTYPNYGLLFYRWDENSCPSSDDYCIAIFDSKENSSNNPYLEVKYPSSYTEDFTGSFSIGGSDSDNIHLYENFNGSFQISGNYISASSPHVPTKRRILSPRW